MLKCQTKNAASLHIRFYAKSTHYYIVIHQPFHQCIIIVIICIFYACKKNLKPSNLTDEMSVAS